MKIIEEIEVDYSQPYYVFNIDVIKIIGNVKSIFQNKKYILHRAIFNFYIQKWR